MYQYPQARRVRAVKKVIEWDSDSSSYIELNTDGLLDAVEHKAEYPIFQDSYGSGVALIDQQSFDTYIELADAYEVNYQDFVIDWDPPVDEEGDLIARKVGAFKRMDLLDELYEQFGQEQNSLTDEIVQAMRDQAFEEVYDYIGQMHGF